MVNAIVTTGSGYWVRTAALPDRPVVRADGHYQVPEHERHQVHRPDRLAGMPGRGLSAPAVGGRRRTIAEHDLSARFPVRGFPAIIGCVLRRELGVVTGSAKV